MERNTFLALSFSATIAYGWLAIAGLIFAAVQRDSGGACVLALLSAGAAYLCQSAATHAEAEPKLALAARCLQIASAGLWLAGLVAL